MMKPPQVWVAIVFWTAWSSAVWRARQHASSPSDKMRSSSHALCPRSSKNSPSDSCHCQADHKSRKLEVAFFFRKQSFIKLFRTPRGPCWCHANPLPIDGASTKSHAMMGSVGVAPVHKMPVTRDASGALSANRFRPG